MAKVTIKDSLYERVKELAVNKGYSSAEELIENAVENVLRKAAGDVDDQLADDQLRGLGYIE